MMLRRITASATPVDAPTVSDHLRVPHDDATAVEAVRLAAHDLVAEMSGRVLGEETWAVSVAVAPDRLTLPKSPVRSLVSVTYYDDAGVSQTATLADFYLFADDDKAVVTPKPGKTWPTLQDRDDAMTVTFIAGYTTIPAGLKHAVLMLSAHLYDNRSAVTEGALTEVPLAAQSLINLHKLGWVKG